MVGRLGFEPRVSASKAGGLSINRTALVRMPRLELGSPTWKEGNLPLIYTRWLRVKALPPRP